MKKIKFIPLSDNDILKQDINRLKNKKNINNTQIKRIKT